ncbi:hypothetical protein [Kangsaoukella pontilimi]|uniref:hypothetical protein n=1 Tax=Kangsaoukella pontilimi TaxID=2691042 RepID=UPI001D0AE9C3|nr:hypothetical protein [Kangsaoukella pontilimi]
MTLRPLAFAVAFLASPALSQSDIHAPYAGLDSREIAALSEDDIAEIEAGQGWGLALPAELNGVPGPTHLIELAAEIGLTEDQISGLTVIRDEMRRDAIAAGALFLAAEKALNDAFVAGPPSPEALETLVSDAGVARARLRHAHLAAHLKTAPLLRPGQIAAYNRLRGYSAAYDPCLAPVPEGHDEAMWRRHNGCG